MATAIGTYATLANVKTRLGITNATDDARLQRFCDWANQWVESKTGRVLAPIAGGGPFVFDGADALEGGRLLPMPGGILTITTLEVALYTGGAFSVIPATDYFLRPTAQERDPGWPATELWMTNLPSAGNAAPYFPDGLGNIRITGPAGATLGWPAQPDDVVAIAEKIVVTAWQARGSGERNRIGGESFGGVVSSALDGYDWHTLGRYTVKTASVI